MEENKTESTESKGKANKIEKAVLIYILVISVINLFVASYIEINKVLAIDSCFKGMAGCAVVDASAFSDIAGLPLSIIGILAFLVIAILALAQIKKPSEKRKKLLGLLILLAAIFSLYLIFLQAFIIKAFCRYCLFVDLLTLSMFFASLILFLL